MKATSRHPAVLVREGWNWDEVYEAAGVSAIETAAEIEAAKKAAR